MIIKACVTPNAKRNDISEENEILKIRTTAKAAGGEANRSVIMILSDFYSVKASSVRIIRGLKSRDKTVEIS